MRAALRKHNRAPAHTSRSGRGSAGPRLEGSRESEQVSPHVDDGIDVRLEKGVRFEGVVVSHVLSRLGVGLAGVAGVTPIDNQPGYLALRNGNGAKLTAPRLPEGLIPTEAQSHRPTFDVESPNRSPALAAQLQSRISPASAQTRPTRAGDSARSRKTGGRCAGSGMPWAAGSESQRPGHLGMPSCRGCRLAGPRSMSRLPGRSVLAVALLHLPQHDGDRGGVDVRLLHQQLGPLKVVRNRSPRRSRRPCRWPRAVQGPACPRSPCRPSISSP